MSMKPFAYASATSIEEAVEALTTPGGTTECRPLAGGTDLVAMMKDGLVEPEKLVNLKTIPGLDGIALRSDGWHIGALTTLAALGAHPGWGAEDAMAGLVAAVEGAASPQLRHMATLGGNLVQRPRCWYFRNREIPCWRKGGRRCFAFRGENKVHSIFGGGPCYAVHPSDPAVALLALDAAVLVVGPRDRREVSLEAFYQLPVRDRQYEDGYHPVTILAANELIAEVVIPRPERGARSVYVKATERGAWDFALVSVAISIVRSGTVVEKARIAMGGVAPIPWRAGEAEAALANQTITAEVIEQVAAAAVAGARPLQQNAYKVDLVKGVVRQALAALA